MRTVAGAATALAWAIQTVRRAGTVVVIEAWDRQCAFCGFDGAAGGGVVGIEAAHVRWFKLGGPDDLDNGLALCSLHHKLFDRGALGLDANYHVQVSTAPFQRERTRASEPTTFTIGN